jgi:ABC-type nitrate/sulfonate/bicarbonate transport system substrate-binding protein
VVLATRRDRLRGILPYLAGAVVILAGILIYRGRHQTEPLYRIRLAVPGFQSSALLLLADAKGFLRDERVEATFEFLATGRECLDRVLQGHADLAVAFETPIVHALLAGNNVSIYTEVHSSEKNTAVVARKTRGIETVADLIGKTVAAVPKTNAEFLLDLYLRSHLIDPRKVKVKSVSIAEAVQNLIDEKVDASALWQPYVSQAIAKEPDKFVLFRSSYYSEFSMLAGLRDNIDSQQDSLYAVLRALIRANHYFEHHRKDARALVDKILSEKKFFVSHEAWDQMDIHLGLSATLLTMLNEEAKWYSAQKAPLPNGHLDLKSVLRGRYLTSLAPRLVTYE